MVRAGAGGDAGAGGAYAHGTRRQGDVYSGVAFAGMGDSPGRLIRRLR